MPTIVKWHGPAALTAGSVVNNDVNASAAIVGSKLAANARREVARSRMINIDNGAGTTLDEVLIKPTVAITLTSARIVYVTETTGTVAGANVKLGTTLGGNEIVTATAFENSKAVGTQTALSLAAAAIGAGEALFVRHTGIAATAAGEYYVEVEFTVND